MRALTVEQPMSFDSREASRGDTAGIGEEIFSLAAEIYPICRSITGDGVRETLKHLKRHIDLAIREVPTGTRVFDWVVPREWNVRDAFIKDAAGNRVVDFRQSNLHVLNYSTAVHAKMDLAELREHIFTLPDQPDVVPYRTSYYAEHWGFCMAHSRLLELQDDIYEVFVDSSLVDGQLTYGEHFHQGESADEILLSTHICHPSLANDNCSGLALLTYVAKRLRGRRTRFSYRFLFSPGTIGAITWLAHNEHDLGHIKHGLVVSGVGDGGGPTYKKSRNGNATIDQVMTHVLEHRRPGAVVLDFMPYGYDERQFCSPGINLPVGLFQRSQFGTYPEYHTSADDLQFIRPVHLEESYGMISAALDVIEGDYVPINTMPKGEPQLGRRGLYNSVGGDKYAPLQNMALLWVLNLADGKHSLLDIANRAHIPFGTIADAARRLREKGLLVEKTEMRAG
jgi:aminopeptidase-like protein